mgnify:CR=1 FL=1
MNNPELENSLGIGEFYLICRIRPDKSLAIIHGPLFSYSDALTEFKQTKELWPNYNWRLGKFRLIPEEKPKLMNAPELQDLSQELSERQQVPIWGLENKNSENCRIENRTKECGCGFGQCLKGLIF